MISQTLVKKTVDVVPVKDPKNCVPQNLTCFINSFVKMFEINPGGIVTS